MEQSPSSGQSLDLLRGRKDYVAGELVVLGTLAAMTAAGSAGPPEDPLGPLPFEMLP